MKTDSTSPWVRALVTDSPMAIGFSRDGTMLDANPAYVRLFGYVSVEELRGTSLLGLIAERERPEIVRRISARQVGEVVPAVYEVTGLRRDGSEFPFLIHVTRVVLDDGPLTIASITDISEAKRFEKSLADSLEFNRRLIQASTIGILAYAAEGPCVLANEAAADFVGAPISVLQQQNFRTIASWKVSGLLTLAEAALATGEVQTADITILSQFGRQSRIHCRMVAFDSLGKQHLLFIAHDITEHVNTLSALRKSEERLRLALDATGDGPWDWQLGDGLHLSPRCVFLLGLPPDQSSPDLDLLVSQFLPEDAERVRAMVLDNAATDHVIELPLQEHSRCLLVRGRVLERDAAGRPVRLIGTVADITARKRDEAERRLLDERTRQAQKLESLGSLARGIAHDFNNLLTSIIGNVELAGFDIPATSEAAARLRAATNAAQRAGELCRQMLTYSGGTTIQGRAVDLRAVVSDVREILTTSMLKKATLRIVSADHAVFVSADVTQLRQVILNLTLNAAEALPDGEGTITISVGAAAFVRDHKTYMPAGTSLPDGDYAFLEVVDTGHGMDAETRERVFDPFFSTKFTGRGLGMAVVHGVARAHGAGIVIDSELGRGTTVRVLFPGVPAPSSLPEAAQRRPSRDLRGTVLVVDDDDAVGEILVRMLELLGFTVHRAVDGAQALQMVANGAYDVLLLDLDMPVMDGPTALRTLRASGNHVPVIVCSGDGKFRLDGSPGLLATDGLLRKPFDLEELDAVVRRVLTGRRTDRA